MICGNCGYENDGYSEFCVNCGAPVANYNGNYNGDYNGNYNGNYNGGYNDGYYDAPAVQPKPAPDGMGIASMVLGIVSLILTGDFAILAVVGLILGVISYKKTKTDKGSSGFAIAGIITSVINLVIVIVGGLISAIVAVVCFLLPALGILPMIFMEM